MLEKIGFIALTVFVAAAVSLIITSILRLRKDSRVLDKIFYISLWVYGAFGFIGVGASFINVLIK